jgi:hypothetical protein
MVRAKVQTPLSAQQGSDLQTVRLKILPPELGEEPEVGTMVEKDRNSLTLVLDGDAGTRVTLSAGEIRQLYGSNGKNRRGGMINAGLISALGWIAATKVISANHGENDPSFGGDVLLTPVVGVIGGFLFGPFFEPEEWEEMDVVTFFSEAGVEKAAGVRFRIPF